RECHLPSHVLEALPPLQCDDAPKTEVCGEIAHPPSHDADLGRRQFPERRFVEMIEMGVSQQHEIDRWQMRDAQPRALDSFQQKNPVREVGINQNVQIIKLSKKRSMPNPGERDLAVIKCWKFWLATFARALCQQGLPNHLAKERSWIEMVTWSQFLERPGNATATPGRVVRVQMSHFRFSTSNIRAL